MRRSAGLLFVIAVLGGPLPEVRAASTTPNGMGFFFSDAVFTTATSNAGHGSTLTGYLVLLNADVAAVGGYECRLAFSTDQVFVGGATGTSGWTNALDSRNHLVTFDPPKPVAPDRTVVLSAVTLFVFTSDPVDILLGPQPAGPGYPGWDGPVVVGATVADRRPAFLTTGVSGEGPQVVATINGAGVVADAGRSWSHVKGLFR